MIYIMAREAFPRNRLIVCTPRSVWVPYAIEIVPFGIEKQAQNGSSKHGKPLKCFVPGFVFAHPSEHPWVLIEAVQRRVVLEHDHSSARLKHEFTVRQMRDDLVNRPLSRFGWCGELLGCQARR